MKGRRACVLINITGGFDMTLFEVDEAPPHPRRGRSEANIISARPRQAARRQGPHSVVATGIDAEAVTMPRPALTLVAKGRPRHESRRPARRMEATAQHSRSPAYAGMTRIRDDRVPEIVAQQAGARHGGPMPTSRRRCRPPSAAAM
jgi:cell division protein FtsZ